MVLGGGVLRRHLYVIEGMAGAGKTTLALHFLLAGRAAGERGLWITTAETPDELQTAAHAYGWSLEGVEVLALPMVDRMAHPDQRQTLFPPAHVELDETMQEILTTLACVQPERVVLDGPPAEQGNIGICGVQVAGQDFLYDGQAVFGGNWMV